MLNNIGRNFNSWSKRFMSRLIGFKATYLGFQSIIMPLWITLYVRYSPESGSECTATLLQSFYIISQGQCWIQCSSRSVDNLLCRSSAKQWVTALLCCDMSVYTITCQLMCWTILNSWTVSAFCTLTNLYFCCRIYVSGAPEPVPQVPRPRDQCWKQNLWISLRAGCRSSDSAIILA